MHEQNVLTALLDNENFLSWARKRDDGERAYWEKWVEHRGCQKQLIDQALALLDLLGKSATEVPDVHVAQFVNKALVLAKQQERRSFWTNISPAIRRVAAAVLFLTSLTWAGYLLKYRNDGRTSLFSGKATQTATQTLTEASNTAKALKYVQLPDGSSVVLHQGSRINFPKTFAAGKREVFLTGEAFFEVTKDPANPFVVHTNGLITQVHGTSFSIRSGSESEHVVVSVKTGTVSLFAEQDKKETDKREAQLILRPNQKAEFDPSRRTLTRIAPGKIRQAAMQIEEQIFSYSATPVSQVFDALENAYGIQISFDREKMAACSITAVLGDEPLENKLKWICTILEASYRMEDERIMITGNSCQ